MKKSAYLTFLTSSFAMSKFGSDSDGIVSNNDSLSDYPQSVKKKLNKDASLNKQLKEESRNKKRGLKKFEYGESYVWALNKKKC